MQSIANKLPVLFSLALLFSGAVSAQTGKTKMVGGSLMYPSRNIIENAIHSRDHTTLVAAVKAAGLVETLEGPGPFTVFAPTNEAFDKLPSGTVSNLLKPVNKSKLAAILTYHVLAGKFDTGDLIKMIRKQGGMAKLRTVNGGYITAMMKGHHIWLMDETGHKAEITISDVSQSNGVIQVINAVLMPGM